VHSDPAGAAEVTRAPVHFSALKYIAQSPAHYRYAADNRSPQSASQRLGSAVDILLLGDSADVAVYQGKRGGPDFRAQLKAFPKAQLVTPGEYAKACIMAEAVEQNRQAMDLLQGHRQRPIEWRWLDRLCGGKPDVFSLDLLTELKTGKTAHPERFMSSARWYGYHAQLAWYRRGLIECGFGTPASYWIVAVESAPPYPVTVFRMTDNALDLGERMCRAWLERLLVCEASDTWPAYTEAAVPFDIVEEEGFSLKIDGEDVEVA
jgi:hypothetical protein